MNNIKNLVKLHYSSIFALKKTALIILALAVFMTISNNDGSMLPFGAALLVMVLNYNSLAYESNSKSDFLIYSLPVKPKEYVLSKYIFGFINVIISIIFADVLYMVLNMFNYISQQDIPVVIINIAVIIVGMIIVDIVNPIAIVVGFNKARIMPICFSSTIVFALSKIDFFNINISVGIMETIVAIVGVILTTASYFITAHLYEKKDIN